MLDFSTFHLFSWVLVLNSANGRVLGMEDVGIVNAHVPPVGVGISVFITQRLVPFAYS